MRGAGGGLEDLLQVQLRCSHVAVLLLLPLNRLVWVHLRQDGGSKNLRDVSVAGGGLVGVGRDGLRLGQ